MDNIIKHFKLNKNLIQEQIITRFPPEPSGLLHIGHAFALLWNWVAARKYGGKIILRFDNTNPSKSQKIYETSIIKTIQDLGLDYDKITYATDYFDNMIAFATQLIREGNAYVDDTPSDIMQQQKISKIASHNRHNNPEQNLNLWTQMLDGNIKNSILRLKIDITSDNLCMRDPVIYRSKDISESKDYEIYSNYHVFPTYDFACPITDYLDQITHVFRSCEFIDRNAQYLWILKALNLKIPVISNYKKLQFEEASCSKRMIRKLIADGIIQDWNDLRLLTIDSLKRLGLVNNTIYEYCGHLGFTTATCTMKIGSLWALNKRYIDKIATRVFAIEELGATGILLDQNDSIVSVPKFNRNKDLGNRELYCGQEVLVNSYDLAAMKLGEFTLINYCNVLLDLDNYVGHVTSGTHKDTKLKVSWISSKNKVRLEIRKYSYDFTKPVVTKYFLGECWLSNIQPGDIIQVYQSVYYICDTITDKLITLNEIPIK